MMEVRALSAAAALRKATFKIRFTLPREVTSPGIPDSTAGPARCGRVPAIRAHRYPARLTEHAELVRTSGEQRG